MVFYDSAEKQIEPAIAGVKIDILIGILLAVIIVWLFLGNFRSTVITAVALPNSLIGAFFLISCAGFTINIITLMALSLSVGLLIDDSIVVRENIFRHIEEGESPKDAAVNGTNEVSLAVLSTTLSIMAVFIPISFMNGIIGRYFKQFGLTVAFALAVSLIDAFTSAPMLSAYWYHKTGEAVNAVSKFFSVFSGAWHKFYANLNLLYRDVLAWALDHKGRVMIAVVVLFILSLLSLSYIGGNYVNNTDSGQVNISLQTYPGATLDATDSVVKDIEAFIAKQPYIDEYNFMDKREPGKYKCFINTSR